MRENREDIRKNNNYIYIIIKLQGAAYGIAGIIKGLGILSLKQLDVMGKLTEAIQEKKNYKYREGINF